MKSIKSRLLIYVGLIVFIFSTILFYRTYRLITANLENLINQQLALALNFDLAIRGYVAETIRPLMFDLVDEGEFKPEAMSTSFVAREIFNKVRTKFPDYIIKFSAENPRNPANRAGLEELKMIKFFSENPQEKVWTGEIKLGNKPYFAKFSAMRMEPACLRCHGNPADAPEELLEIYGSEASFNMPLGKVAGMDTIAIPKDKITKIFFNEAINNFALLGGGLCLLCISLAFIFKFVITDRLSKITAHFAHTEEQDEVVEIKAIELGGQDEITTLTSNFNNTLKSIFQSAPIGIGLVTGRVLGWTNDLFQQMVGYTKDELEGKNARILYESDEEYERIGFEMQSQIQKAGLGSVESRFKSKDDRFVDILLRSAPIIPGDLSEGRIFTVMDITQTKLMQDQLIRSERLAATGQLAASIAHEINSPLQAVTVLLGTLKKKYYDDDELANNLELLKGAFGSIRDTVKNLLDLNRPGKVAKQTTNVNHIIEKNIDLVRSHMKKNKIKVNLDLTPNLPDIHASPMQLNQCLLNLINNAVESMAGTATHEIEPTDSSTEDGQITIKTIHKKGNIIIEIIDTGPGIPEEDLPNIFDPFFTKKKKMGMGVGLSTCHGIVQDHGGIITAENSPQRGVAMTITLPAT
jgi:PAS domain S-box-containing protein